MVNYISLINHQGKLFIAPPKPEQDGLTEVIELKNKNQTYIPVDVAFNAVGDAFLVSDSRGQVTLFHLTNNRYTTIVSDLKQACPCVSFISKLPQDQLFVALKDKSIQVHALNGKLLDKFQPKLHHNTEIKQLQNNVKMGLLLSVSGDVCVLWNTKSGSNISKERSLFAKQGCTFTQAKFTFDGQGIATLFKDGELIIWTLDSSSEEPTQSVIYFKTNQVTDFDMSPQFIVAGGPSCPYIIMKALEQSKNEDRYFTLPAGCKGTEQLKLLRDKFLLCYISSGYFYVVDLSSTQDKLKVKLNIRIPSQSVKKYDVDYNMSTIVLTTSNGSVYIYDLAKAFENEAELNKKKLQMGVEDDLVNTYLQEVNQEHFIEQMQSLSFIGGANASVMSNIQQHPHQQSTSSFMRGVTGLKGINYRATVVIDDDTLPIAYQQQQQQQDDTMFPIRSQETVTNPFIQKSFNNEDPHRSTTINKNVYQQPQQQFTSMQSQKAYGGASAAPIVQMTHQQSQMRSMMSITEGDESSSAFMGGPSTMTQQNNNNNSRYMKSKIQAANKSTISKATTNNNNKTSQLQSTQQNQMSIDENYQPEYKFTNSTLTQSTMAQFNLPKLKQMLKSFGEFPEKYRTMTWKYLLDLPLNQSAFEGLMRRGVHPAYKNLHKKYPIDSYKLYNKLVRILSAIGYWCPLFLDVEFMPQIVFPFIKTIPNDDMLVFEIVVALVVQWMQTWFESYPAEPHVILMTIEQIIEMEDPRLVTHLRENAFTPTHYAWPLLKTLLTDVLPKDDWLKLMDYLFTYRDDPELINYVCAAFLLQQKGAILQFQSIEQLHSFLSKSSGCNFKKIMANAFKLHSKYKTQLPLGMPANNLPLQKDNNSEYPMFIRYPEQIVSYQARIREKILAEEEELQKKEQLLLDLKQQAEDVLVQEQRFRLQQEATFKAEADRKLKLQQQQEAMLQERIRLDEMARIARLEHVKRIEGALNNAFKQQEDLKQQEAHITDKEFDQRQRAAQYEYEARMQDEMIANLEFKSNQKLLEMMQKRTSEDQVRKLKNELEQRQKEEDQRDRVLQEKWRLEDQEQRLKNELMRQTLQQQASEMSTQAERTKIEQKLRIQEYEKELQLIKIEEQRKLRQMEEECILRKQQVVDEMRKKVDYEATNESQMMWKQMNEEKDRERLMAEERIRELDHEKHRLESAIEREREERERIEFLERQKQYKEQFEQVKQSQEIDKQRSEQVKRQMEKERIEADNSRQYLMQKELEIRGDSSQNIMQFIKQTENNINQRVEAIEQHQKYQSENPHYQQQEEVRKKQEMENRMKRLVEERERQHKEYNESLAQKIVNQSRVLSEKENYDNNVADQEYQQQQYYQRSFGQQQFQSQSQGKFPPQNYDEGHSYQDNNPYNGGGYRQQPYQGRDDQVSPSSQRSSEDSAGDSSSLTSSHNTQALIERHYKTKQAFEDHKKTQSIKNVFTYNPAPPTQLQGHNLSTEYSKQQQSIGQNSYYPNQQQYPQQQQKSKRQMASDSQSVLDSSSSSEDEISMSSRSSHSQVSSQYQQPHGQYDNQGPQQNYDGGYASYDGSSSMSSSLQSSQYKSTQQMADMNQYR